MATHVYYHHPRDPHYSLACVTQDTDEITTSGQDAFIEHYDLDEQFFVLYTNRGASGTVEDLEDVFQYSIEEMSPEDRTIIVRLLQIFEEEELAQRLNIDQEHVAAEDPIPGARRPGVQITCHGEEDVDTEAVAEEINQLLANESS